MAAALSAARWLRLAGGRPGLASARSVFVARKSTHEQPNWFGVGLAFTTTAALWAFVEQIFSKKYRRLCAVS